MVITGWRHTTTEWVRELPSSTRSPAFNKNIISAPQFMKNQNYIIIMKDELWYKGTSFKMHMKTLENLYILIGKWQPEYAIKYLQLSTTEHNSRVSHNTLHKNTFYTPNIHNLPYLPSTIAEADRTLGLKYQAVQQATTTGVSVRIYGIGYV
jgi:hypothetical protein